MKRIFGSFKVFAPHPHANNLPQKSGSISALPKDSVYADVQEKSLSKIAKAAWNGDADKLSSALKKGDVDEVDDHQRCASEIKFGCVCLSSSQLCASPRGISRTQGLHRKAGRRQSEKHTGPRGHDATDASMETCLKQHHLPPQGH
jgi:hypothetical protein